MLNMSSPSFEMNKGCLSSCDDCLTKCQLVRVKTTRASGLKPCWAFTCRQDTQQCRWSHFKKSQKQGRVQVLCRLLLLLLSSVTEREWSKALYRVSVNTRRTQCGSASREGMKPVQRSCHLRRVGIPGLHLSLGEPGNSYSLLGRFGDCVGKFVGLMFLSCFDPYNIPLYFTESSVQHCCYIFIQFYTISYQSSAEQCHPIFWQKNVRKRIKETPCRKHTRTLTHMPAVFLRPIP